MTSSLDMIRGRSNVVTLTNKSGGALVAGDVCIIDTSNDEAATTTTSAASVLKVYIAAESIANDATGKFYSAGFCPLVTPSASTTRGRYLFTHTVAKQAAENATYGAGAFGVILKSGTTPSVWLFGSTAQGSGGGDVATDAIWDAAGDLAVGTGANAASKLTKGADGTVLQMASGAVGWQVPALTYATSALTGNVTLTTGGTLYDGPSISLAAGTWLITGIAHLVDGTPFTAMAAELWDGTNHLAAGSVHSGTDYGSIALSCIAVFGAPVTAKIRATSVHNGGVMYATQQQAGSTGTNNATIISAVRIA